MDKHGATKVADKMYAHLSAMVEECGIVDLEFRAKLLSGDVVEVSMVDRKRVGFGHNSRGILRAYGVGEYPKVSLRFDVYI